MEPKVYSIQGLNGTPEIGKIIEILFNKYPVLLEI